jgi:hypothetical protein
VSDTGWVWVQGDIHGTLDNYWHVYSWNRATFTSREAACAAGGAETGHDDFNVAHLVNGEVVWWGWMDEPHPLEDAAEAAKQHGWTVAAEVPS